MSLPASIDDSVSRIREVVEQLRGHLQGARHLRMPEECIRELTAASLRLAAISSECTRIESDMAAARMTGQAEKRQLPVESLELHPCNLAPEPQEELAFIEMRQPCPEMVEIERAMIRSLHRVKDDSLDRKEDE